MLQTLRPEDYSVHDDMDETILCNDAAIRIYDSPQAGTCTVLSSSSGWKYQLLNVVKNTIFGIVVRGQVVAAPPSFKGDRGFYHEMVAIKMYSRRKLEDVILGKLKEDPMAEIAILQNMKDSHPNVLSQFECCADEENIYSVMPLLPGHELYDVVVEEGSLSEMQAKIVFRQMVEGLKNLHQHGVAHQDISLENVLFDKASQQAVIIDFGLAVRCSHRQELVENSRAGKLFYMAPEVIGGVPLIDPFASDVWSLGISLLYMLIGFPPIEYALDTDIRYQHIREGKLKQLLQTWGITLSDNVLDLIQQLLQVNPLHRPSLDKILSHSWLQEKSFLLDSVSTDSATDIFSFAIDQTHSKQNLVKG